MNIIKHLYYLFSLFRILSIGTNSKNLGHSTNFYRSVLSSIYNILKNEKYIGTFVFNSEVIRIPSRCPAIISKELWERINAKLATNKKTTGTYSAKIIYLLSGLIYCGNCGGSMIGNRAKMGRNKTEYAYYECNTRKRTKSCDMKPINKAFVEEKVLEALYENLFADNVIDLATDMIYNHAASQSTEIPKQIAALEKQLGTVEIEIKNIVNSIATGMFHESMKEKMDELEASKSALRIRIEEAKLQQRSHSLTREQIRSFLDHYRNIKEMSPEEQKKAIQVFVERVTVYNDHIDMDILTVPGNNPSKNIKTSDLMTGGSETIQSGLEYVWWRRTVTCQGQKISNLFKCTYLLILVIIGIK